MIILRPLSVSIVGNRMMIRLGGGLSQKLHFGRCKWNQNPHLINDGDVDLKIGSRWFTDNINIVPNLLGTRLRNYVSL